MELGDKEDLKKNTCKGDGLGAAVVFLSARTFSLSLTVKYLAEPLFEIYSEIA